MLEIRNSKSRRRVYKQAGWQILAIIAIACLAALGVNQFRTGGIAIPGDWSAESRFAGNAGKDLIISLKEARNLYEGNAAVFVDARPGDQYARGHIKEALSLPWEKVDRRFMEVAGRLETAETIIAYCDGAACQLSHDLALFLKDMGFENVRVLVNGWTRWQDAGLPVETGGPE